MLGILATFDVIKCLFLMGLYYDSMHCTITYALLIMRLGQTRTGFQN